MTTLIIILIVAMIAQTATAICLNVKDKYAQKQMMIAQQSIKDLQSDYINEKQRLENIVDTANERSREWEKECKRLREAMRIECTTGAYCIVTERQRQINDEGYDKKHDMHHSPKEFVNAAIAYAIYEDEAYVNCDENVTCYEKLWPWEKQYFKPKDKKRNLIKAGALIAAAIDRLNAERDEQAQE